MSNIRITPPFLHLNISKDRQIMVRFDEIASLCPYEFYDDNQTGCRIMLKGSDAHIFVIEDYEHLSELLIHLFTPGVISKEGRVVQMKKV